MSKFLPLSHFIQRSRTLALYRRTLRSAGKQHQMTSIERDDIKRRIVEEYRRNQQVTDQSFIRMCLVQADQQALFLESGAAASLPEDDDGTDKWTRAGGPDEQDVLGRVGDGWPWRKE